MLIGVLKKCFFGILILGIFLTALNYLGIYLDEEPLEYSGLIPLVDIDSEDNGFDLLEAGLKQSQKLDKQVLDEIFSDQWDQSKAETLLTEHADKFELIKQTLNKEGFKTHPTNFEANLPNYTNYISLTTLVLIQSKYLAEESKFEEAISHLELALKFSETIKKDQSAILIAYMIGIVAQHQVLTWAHQFVSNYSLNKVHLGSLAKLFENDTDLFDDGFEMILSGETAYMETMPESVLNPSFVERIKNYFEFRELANLEFGYENSIYDLLKIPSYHYFFQDVRTANRAYLKYVDLQSQAKNTYCNHIDYSKPTTASHLLETFGMNYIGNHDFGNIMKVFFERRCFANFYTQAIKTIVALKRYSNQTQSTASSLRELIPIYLDKISVDPFTGETLLYNPEAQTIYSLGVNSIDDGGEKQTYVRRCYSDSICASNPTVAIRPESIKSD